MTSAALRAAARFEPPLEDGIGRVVIDRADDAINAIDLDLVESLAEADARSIARDAVVARQRQLQSATQRCAVDRGD